MFLSGVSNPRFSPQIPGQASCVGSSSHNNRTYRIGSFPKTPIHNYGVHLQLVIQSHVERPAPSLVAALLSSGQESEASRCGNRAGPWTPTAGRSATACRSTTLLWREDLPILDHRLRC